MYVVTVIGLGVLGASLGSFAVAQVWRLRAKQLVYDKSVGEVVDGRELSHLKPLTGRKASTDRSQCLSCKQQLRWFDLLPLVSWLSLGGKCRYCREPIGVTEFVAELALGLLFALSFIFWPTSFDSLLEVVKLILWLTALVVLFINFIYDLRWSLLVPLLNWLLIGLGAGFAIILSYQSSDAIAVMLSTIGGVAILGGLYGLLWLISRGRWIGEGDIYLGAGLALFLADYRLAFVALFAANLIGTLLLLPGMLTGRVQRGTQIPFGPLLIAGAVLTWFIGRSVVDWYMSLMIPF